jgi:hypothetical protein
MRSLHVLCPSCVLSHSVVDALSIAKLEHVWAMAIKLRSWNKFIRYERCRGRLVLLVVGAYGFGGVPISNSGMPISSSWLGFGVGLLDRRLRDRIRHLNGHDKFQEMFFAVRSTWVQLREVLTMRV